MLDPLTLRLEPPLQMKRHPRVLGSEGQATGPQRNRSIPPFQTMYESSHPNSSASLEKAILGVLCFFVLFW